MLVESATYSLNRTAVDLAFDHVRIDHGATIITYYVAQQCYLARFDVYFARAHVCRVGPDQWTLCSVSFADLHAGGDVRGESKSLEVGDVGDVGQAQFPVRHTSNCGSALSEFDVIGVDFERVRSDSQNPLTQDPRGLSHAPAVIEPDRLPPVPRRRE